ncbi:MarR family transcriptional regulator [Domibacillus sp. DTU_2020_1001157_1_SI_ALB_TIR_016]|uniref:MarR family winged helix-turn-helix transcriptional regulator n=1 Tax=Domibacillus sp. DTU_2020_1001157_1_SI_ALB_TIR_016 TaxID=3077789 RepID=UPI0028E77A3D|nr:MarR family transcriptional regulator [Domibacillus sp. DTU_2020_1001157_1_SI_ALB_TIR_016]WNS80691.1 MarR family transcriptional regulator [Domibacillus sp. DTU_2020_1001157_1_SI_ALB_TIR_016]
MENDQKAPLFNGWLALTRMQAAVAQNLEGALQQEHGLSLNECYVLLFLSEAPEKKLKLYQLQEMVGLSQSALSRLVNRLEEKNCQVLRRHSCEDDRRAIYASLTKEGEEKLEKVLNTFCKTLESAFSSSAVQESLQSAFRQLKR